MAVLGVFCRHRCRWVHALEAVRSGRTYNVGTHKEIQHLHAVEGLVVQALNRLLKRLSGLEMLTARNHPLEVCSAFFMAHFVLLSLEMYR